jgi:hypothetical protein
MESIGDPNTAVKTTITKWGRTYGSATGACRFSGISVIRNTTRGFYGLKINSISEN